MLSSGLFIALSLYISAAAAAMCKLRAELVGVVGGGDG